MKPLITEKAIMSIEAKNTLIFEVDRKVKKADIKKQILAGHKFSDQEVEDSIVRRSSDSLLYGTLTSYEYPIPKEIIEPNSAPSIIENVSKRCRALTPSPNKGISPRTKNSTSTIKVHFNFSLNDRNLCVGP